MHHVPPFGDKPAPLRAIYGPCAKLGADTASIHEKATIRRNGCLARRVQPGSGAKRIVGWKARHSFAKKRDDSFIMDDRTV